MSAPNRREYFVSSAVIEEVLDAAQAQVDVISQKIGEGEHVTVSEQLGYYASAFGWLQSKLYAAVSDAVAQDIRKTIDAQQDVDDAAVEFPL